MQLPAVRAGLCVAFPSAVKHVLLHVRRSHAHMKNMGVSNDDPTPHLI